MFGIRKILGIFSTFSISISVSRTDSTVKVCISKGIDLVGANKSAIKSPNYNNRLISKCRLSECFVLKFTV